MQVIENPSIDFWQAVARACPYATFFHTPLWAQLICQTFAYQNLSRAFVCDDGTRVVLPLVGHKRAFGKVLSGCRSMAPGVYGGFIADGPLTPELITAIEDSLLSGPLADLTLIGNPLQPYMLSEKFNRRELVTHVLRLEPGYATLEANFKPKARRRVKGGLKKGVQISRAATWEEYQDYYRTYEASQERWGERLIHSYPLQFFRAIFELGQGCDAIQLWIARVDGCIIGGTLCLYWNRHAVEWHAAFLREFSSYSPNNVIKAALIKDACKRGFAVYDFNPSAGQEGVEQFKESFGAKRVTIPVWRWKNPRPAIWLLKRLPD